MDAIIDDFELCSFPNIVSMKYELISRSSPILEANPAGRAYKNNAEGI